MKRGISFARGILFYLDQTYLVYDCKLGSFNLTAGKITTWKSTSIFNYFGNSNMNAVGDAGGDLPDLKNDGRMNVYFSGNLFQQNKVIMPNNSNPINIYCVYRLDPIASTRDDTFTIQNASFGAMQITKNADTSKYDYKGYGMCFDEGSQFGHTIIEGGFAYTTNARNVLIFVLILAFTKLIEQTIFTLWVKDLHKVFRILRYMQKRNFIEILQILVKNSYLNCIIMVMIVIYLLMIDKN